MNVLEILLNVSVTALVVARPFFSVIEKTITKSITKTITKRLQKDYKSNRFVIVFQHLDSFTLCKFIVILSMH